MELVQIVIVDCLRGSDHADHDLEFLLLVPRQPVVPEEAGFTVLEFRLACGDVPGHQIVLSGQEAAVLAALIGFPIQIKIVVSRIQMQTEWNGKNGC